jgi:hypothetical protein
MCLHPIAMENIDTSMMIDAGTTCCAPTWVAAETPQCNEVDDRRRRGTIYRARIVTMPNPPSTATIVVVGARYIVPAS